MLAACRLPPEEAVAPNWSAMAAVLSESQDSLALPAAQGWALALQEDVDYPFLLPVRRFPPSLLLLP